MIDPAVLSLLTATPLVPQLSPWNSTTTIPTTGSKQQPKARRTTTCNHNTHHDRKTINKRFDGTYKSVIHIRLGRIKIRVLDKDASTFRKILQCFAKPPSSLGPAPLPVPSPPLVSASLLSSVCLFSRFYIRVSSVD